MIIREMNASFGKLENRSLTLCGGLNILEGGNESGKSTWCAFIRAMLYGIDTSERDSKNTLAVKNRYKPWSGSPMSGTMRLESERFGELTLERRSVGSSPMRDLRVYGPSGDIIPLSENEAGEAIVGIGREAFDRSAFVYHPELPAGDTGELERRILSLVSSGDMDVSYTEAVNRLREWQRKLRLNKRAGEIPETEEKIAGLRAASAALMSKAEGLNSLKEQIRTLETERAALLDELRSHKAAERDAASERLRNVEARFAEAEADLRETARLLPPGDPSAEEIRRLEHAAVSEAERLRIAETRAELIREKQNQIGNLEKQIGSFKPFMGSTAAKAQEIAQEDKETFRKLTVRHEALHVLRRSGFAMLLPLALSVPFFYLFPRDNAIIYTIILSLAVFSLLLPYSVSKAKHRVLELRADLLDKYDASDLSEIDKKLLLYEELQTEMIRLTSQVDELKEEQKKIPPLADEIKSRIYEVFPELEDTADIGTGIRQAASDALSAIERHVRARMLYLSAKQLVEALRPEVAISGTDISGTDTVNRSPSMPKAEAESRLGQVEQTLLILRREAALIEGSMENGRNIDELRAEIERLDRRLASLNKRYDAISLALSALEEADRQLRERFSPALNSAASEIFAVFTRRKYNKVLISREFSAMAGRGDSEGLRRALELSRGTIDQLYLSVRLALCRIVPPEGYALPVILDDAFLSFDDTRLEAALDWLYEESQTRQIILFTCHKREGLYLGDRRGVLVQSVD